MGQQPSPDPRHVTAGLVIGAARALGLILLVGFIGVGCLLDSSAMGVSAEYSCGSLIVNSDGHREAVSSFDTEFSEAVVRTGCADPAGTSIGTEELWRHQLDGVLASGPFRDHAAGSAGWCVLNTECTELRPFEDGEVPPCPDLIGTEALRDDCAAGSACIGVRELVDFGTVNLSEVSTGVSVGFENACDESRFLRADSEIFDDTRRQFVVTDNGCGTPDAVSDHELTAFGTGGDGCVVQFQFEPKDVGVQSASYRATAVEDGLTLPVTLQGEGAGSTPRTLSGESLFCLDPGGADCGTVSVGVVSDGPAGFRITATDVEFVRGTGFSMPAGPATDEILAPGVEARFDVEWCASRATEPRERLQLTVTTTTNESGVTRAFRSTIDAPAPCP